MAGKTITGWVLVTFCYFVTLGVSGSLYRLLFSQPVDLDRASSGIFMGTALLVVPYIVAGIYARRSFEKPVAGALWVSVVPMMAERCLIYLIGTLLVFNGGDGSMNGITTMMFIRGEAAPYYTVPYILLGPFSVLLSMLISRSSRAR